MFSFIYFLIISKINLTIATNNLIFFIKETNEPLNFFTLNRKRRPMTTFTNKSFRKTAIVVALSLSFVIVGCSKNGDGNSGDGNSGDVD